MEFDNSFSSLRVHLKTCLLGGILLLNACATIEGNGGGIQQSASYVDSFPQANIVELAQSAAKDTFKVGDTADISVYNVESLSDTYVVNRTGDIDFPLIGTVRVAGLTTTQLQETLTQKYGSEYLLNPSINVKLESEDIGRIVVDGAVIEPGVFEINDIIRLSEAIALAKGLDEIDTNGSQTYIVREIEGERKVTEVDLRAIRKLGAVDPQVIPNDVIFVQDSSGRILFREFLKTIPLLSTAIIVAARE